jgi:dihydroorotate dehydrogenase
VTLVNCVSGKVLNRDGSPAFGERFVEAGVLGRAIHDSCVASVRRAAGIIRDENLDLAIAAVGGAASADDITRYFAAGPDAVLMGSAPMYLPNLAADVKASHPDW